MKGALYALGVLFATCAPAAAQSGVTGTWQAELTSPWTLVVSAEGTRLTGRVSSCASLPVEIYDGRIDRNAVTFKCKSLDGDRVITFTGVVNGDEIEFTWAKHIRDGGVPPAAADASASALFGASTPPRFRAKRIPADGNVELTAAVNLFQKGVKVEGTLLLPPQVGRVRAVIVVLKYGLGYQLEGDPQWRAVSASLNAGLFYARVSNIHRNPQFDVVRNAAIGGADGLLLLLQRFAQESGHPELTDAPLLLWGHSAAGSFVATFAALHPQRTIAFVRYHTSGAGMLGANLGALTPIPALLLNPEHDESNPRVQAVWKSRRAVGAPWTWALEPNAVHGGDNSDDLKKANDLVIPWIAAVVRQRVSPNGERLRAIAEGSGWLGNNQTREVAPNGALQGLNAEASWLPDEASARAWRVMLGVAK